MITDIVGLLRRGNIDKAYKQIETLLKDIDLLLEREGETDLIKNKVATEIERNISEIRISMHYNDIIYLIDLLDYELKQYIKFDN